jgi:hypothetical protein
VLVVLAVLSVLVAAVPAYAGGSSSPGATLVVPVEQASDGGPPHGLMLSMASWRDRPASELAGWLAYLCAQRPPGPQAGAINELVVMDVASPDPTVPLIAAQGSAHDELDEAQLTVLLPYFPGGSGPCNFTRVYVGTVDLSQQILATPGIVHPYHDEVLDPAAVTAVVDRGAAVAAAFSAYVAASGEHVTWDWYLTQEGFLDYFTDSDGTTAGALAGARTALVDGSQVAARTLALLVRLSRALQAVRTASRILWSPGFSQPGVALFGTGGASRTGWRATMRAFFTSYRDQLVGSANGPGPLVVALQDHVGSSGWSPRIGCRQTMTPADAVAWYRELKTVFVGADLVMNVEQFRRATPYACQQGGLAPGYGAVLAARERFYVREGVTLGPAFDLQAWSASNRSNWGLFRRTAFSRVRTSGGELTTSLSTTDGRPLRGALVEVLECDVTGGSCEQLGPLGASTTVMSGAGGAVRLALPTRPGPSYWRLAVADSLVGLTASGSLGWLASQSALVSVGSPVRVAWTAWTRVRSGSRSVAAGRLATDGGTALPGAEVALVECPTRSGCGAGRRVRTLRTDAHGRVRSILIRAPSRPRYFQWRSSGTSRYQASHSFVLTLRHR